MELLFITNQPQVARAAVEAGARRIFVDLEVMGKSERQKNLSAHMSAHTLSDVGRIRDAVPEATLLVRCNPLSNSSEREIEDVLRQGADMLMLPMFFGPEEVARFVTLVDRRAKVIALVETPAALARLRQILGDDHPPDEVFLGLNDLSLLTGLRFLMEPLSGGLVDHFCHEARRAGVPYGFGGVGIIGSGQVPAELILSEHVRLGSTRVILSRTFRDAVLGPSDNDVPQSRLKAEIDRLLQQISMLETMSPGELEENRRSLVAAVARVVEGRSGAEVKPQ